MPKDSQKFSILSKLGSFVKRFGRFIKKHLLLFIILIILIVVGIIFGMVLIIVVGIFKQVLLSISIKVSSLFTYFLCYSSLFSYFCIFTCFSPYAILPLIHKKQPSATLLRGRQTYASFLFLRTPGLVRSERPRPALARIP